MKKCMIVFMAVVCMFVSNIALAGRNVITNFSGELVSVSIIDSSGTPHSIPGAQGHIGLGNEILVNATVGEGKDLPEGNYTALKYVFKNDFSAAGKVILADGTEYGSTGAISKGPVFKRNQPPENFKYSYHDGDMDWEWCTTSVKDGNLEVTERTNITLDGDTGKNFNVNVTLKYLWFGVDGAWDYFNEDYYIKNQNSAGSEDFKRLDADTIAAPFLDPPEMENHF